MEPKSLIESGLAPATGRAPLGVVLTGGGARAAYQVGVLSWIAKRYADLELPILTGVSAGAINAAYLASHPGEPHRAVTALAELWRSLTVDRVFRSDARTILWTALRWGFRLMSGGARPLPEVRGFLDTEPLRRFLLRVLENQDGELVGVTRNIERERLRAVAVTATSYTTGQTVVFAQGQITPWTRPQRKAVSTKLTVEHVMASAALPIFFPAIQLEEAWYGDGGMRLAAPLSPALHLGAGRILAISTRYDRSSRETARPQHVGYPPPAQVLGSLLNAVFLDLIDQDAVRLELINTLLADMPEERRRGLRPIELFVMHPTRDLGRLAAEFEPQLPRAFRFMTRGLGTRETRSPDMLSLLMFQPDYIDELIRTGERDAELRAAELDAFLAPRRAAASERRGAS